MTPAHRLHRTLFAALVPCLIAIIVAAQPSLTWQIALLAPLVALVGLPHGALDHRVAGALWPLATLRHHALFLAGYLGLSATIVALWILAPGIALAAFLAYSAWHFSDDWRQDIGLIQSLPLGTAVITLPALAWQPQVATLFTYLAPPATAASLAAVLHILAIGAVALAALSLACNARRHPWFIVECTALAAAALLTQPLIYFALYFCGLHSPRHFLLTADQLGLTPAQGLRAALPLTAATLAVVTLAGLALIQTNLSLEGTTLTLIFAGLAALTVPHMLLTERFRALA